MEPTAAVLSQDKVAQFMTAGNALFTMRNANSGVRFTFKVTGADDKPGLHFVSVLTGPQNTSDYTYLGILVDGGKAFRHGKKSPIGADAPSTKAINFLVNDALATGRKLPPALEIFHEGRCGRCGRCLTVPESITSGFGPECIKMVNVKE